MNRDGRTLWTKVVASSPAALSAALVLASVLLAMWAAPGNAENAAPDADAGEDITAAPGFDRVLLNDVITLDGSASTDEEIESCTWAWSCTSHTGIVLRNATTPNPDLTVTVEEAMEFRLTLTDPEGLFDTDDVRVVVSVNSMPNAVMLSPTPSPPSYQVSKEIEFSANSSSDPEGRQMKFLWEDGEAELSRLVHFRRRLDTLGPHRITLTVSDVNGGSSQVVTDIIVREDPMPPEASFEVLPRRSDLIYSKSETLRFDATSTSDPNTGETLRYIWETDLSGGSVLGEGQYLNTTLGEGLHNITLTVTDSDLLTDTAWAIVTIENTPPIARITAPDAGSRGGKPTVNVTEQVSFVGTASTDEDGDELGFYWEFEDGSTDEGAEIIHSFSEWGEQTVTLTVDDGSLSGRYSTASFTLSVNTVPNAVMEGPTTVTMGEVFELTANGSSDEDGDPLTFLWDLDADGETDSQGFSVVHVLMEERVHTVTLIVTDGFASSSASVQIEAFYPNERPIAKIAGYDETLNRTMVVPLEDNRGSVQLDASPSYDPDDDMDGNGVIDGRERNNLTFIWDTDAETDADGDGDVDNDEERTGKTLRLTITGTSTKRIVLFVRDRRGSTDRLDIRLRGDHPPRVTELRTDPSSTMLVNGSIKFSIQATDDDRSDIRLLKYDMDFGDGQSVKASATNEMYHTYERSGNYEIKVNVTDGSLFALYSTTLKVTDLSGPEVRFPTSGAKLSGGIVVRGSMRPPSGWTVGLIEVSIDGKGWEEADGTDSWEYGLSTGRLSKGMHTLTVRATVKAGTSEVSSTSVMTFQVVGTEEEGPSVLPFIIGAVLVVAALVLLYLVVFRRKGQSDRMADLMGPPPVEGQMPPMMQPQFRPQVPPVAAPPAQSAIVRPTAPVGPPVKEAAIEPQARKVKVKCPACGKLFTEKDSGERPFHTVCKHCGAKGSIESLPWDDVGTRVEAPQKVQEGPEPLPIVCPSCGELFELKGPAKEAKCPACGAVGELDQETQEKLKEAQEKVKELTLRCPKCSGMFHVREGGQDIICPYCGAKGKLPR